MDKRQLIICRGIQGSGKSTWAKQWAKEKPEERIRFNNDDIRNMLGEYWVPNREKIISTLYHTTIACAMDKGCSIVVDNMNLNPKTCEELAKRVKDFNENFTYDWKYEIEYKNFFIPVEECIRRDAMRPDPIGEKTIKQTWKRYRDFIIQENIKETLSKKPEYVDGGHPAILVDMDGTLCLNVEGRPFFGEGAAEGMVNDIPVEGIARAVSTLYHSGYKVFIVTGREGTPEVIEATKTWLLNNGISVDGLFFRPIKDCSPGEDCKKKLYETYINGKYNVQFVLEDNCKCVKMWREQGLVCLQPNEGKF